MRKLFVRAFRYAIVYAIDDRGVLVLAVAHGSRRPDFWTGRIDTP